MAKKKAQSKAKPAKAAPKPAPARPSKPPDIARAFQLEMQSVAQAPPSNVVTLDPDVGPHFPNSRAVNEALRALLRIVRQVRSA